MFSAYVASIAGLLFLGFVFFAVGQAAVIRNGAQTAADAAALAAAQDVRDQLREGWLGVIDDPAQWQGFVTGRAFVDPRVACRRAEDLAAANEAKVDGCLQTGLGFRVTVHSLDAVGESIVPGVEGMQATATATAVVEPRCQFAAPEPTEEPEQPPTPPVEEPEEEDPAPIPGLACDGEELEIDPEDPVLPDAGDLFYVRLTGDDE
ncbi:pilus assembly protein TadG-related protein [Streptomyces roseolus]|uniref:pilus assembly protein TadG-related protein n=1 Tax=Streptomyces roseolus TaxID=67358 RepID=UPI0037AE3AFC